jgi:hypothetical protein
VALTTGKAPSSRQAPIHFFTPRLVVTQTVFGISVPEQPKKI